jgi:hypothetical protein
LKGSETGFASLFGERSYEVEDAGVAVGKGHLHCHTHRARPLHLTYISEDEAFIRTTGGYEVVLIRLNQVLFYVIYPIEKG